MKHIYIAALIAGSTLQAHAVGKLADVSIIDRNSGAVLATHYYKGEYWVAGAPGARYAIAIRNQLGERILAVTAVDGVNVISGDTAGWGQTGYVFGSGQGYEITGWRKSSAEVAAFEFTAAPNSYAARTGRPKNVGVIGVALFRERPPAPPVIAAEPTGRLEARADIASAASRESAQGAADSAARAAPSPKLGTGHGQREQSYVEHTDFERLQATPNEIIRIRYDSRDNLVAMGVIRKSPPLSPAPNPFPDSPLARYVPDPPGFR